MKILCIGDSNTYGYDPRSYLGSRYPAGVPWPDRLLGHNVINYGMNGMCVPDARSLYPELIRSRDPDLVIVMLGGNDLLNGASAERTAVRMAEFLDPLAAAERPILLIAPPPLQEGSWVPDPDLIDGSKKLAGLYRELAEEKGSLFADAGTWDVDLLFDGVHFSPEGHAAFARGLSEVLDRLSG